MTHRNPFLTAGLVGAGAACLIAAPVARAESRDATTVALGWQTENSDVVCVGSVAAEPSGPASPGDTDAREVDFRVDRPIKGAQPVGSTVRVRYVSHGVGLPWKVGTPHLLLLRRVQTAPGATVTYEPVSGAFSVRPLPSGSAEERFPDLVAAFQSALDAKDPAALRTLLVSWMDDKEPGVAWSAATDFVRHDELHAALTDFERVQIVGAFVRQPIGKNTKGALALAAAATHSDAAVPALVDSLLTDGAKQIRGVVGEALRRMDSQAAEGLLAVRLKGAAPDRQVALLGALAVVGGAGSAPSVRPMLDAADASVRTEAAAALGGMARNARAKDPAARLAMADALAARVLDDAAASDPPIGENEMRARLWALAQLDEPAAFATLRSAAATSTRADVKDYAERLLARPRQSLILR